MRNRKRINRRADGAVVHVHRQHRSGWRRRPRWGDRVWDLRRVSNDSVSNSIFTGNAGAFGGAIANNGSLTVAASTFADNSWTGTGGTGGAITDGGTHDHDVDLHRQQRPVRHRRGDRKSRHPFRRRIDLLRELCVARQRWSNRQLGVRHCHRHFLNLLRQYGRQWRRWSDRQWR